MLTEQDIKVFINKNDYDIRKSNNSRWIDQKCTPDVLNIVADCVFQYVFDDKKKQFSSTDIWRYPYTEDNVRDIFSKPSTVHEKSRNEYDKFFAQPLEMLANARVLKKFKNGNRNCYTVNNLDILEYICLRERNSLSFIKIYCEKVMRDSGLWPIFEEFFTVQNKETYFFLKDSYEQFIISNTPINGNTEVRRIFTKVLNPLAYDRRKCGTERGRISKHIITYSQLMYNRENFRDLNADKPKGMTRNEWKEKRRNKINKDYYKYQSAKAKRFLRKFNDQYRDGISEVHDEFGAGLATQIHHIFPENQYPEISMYLENLVALTPTQHMTKAHPLNNTHRIDLEYQEILLKAKAGSIEENISDVNIENIYIFDNFVEVINTGFRTDYDVVENDFITVMNIITDYYMHI